MIVILLEIIAGLSAGALTAAGYFAVITSIGVVSRIAGVTKTAHWLLRYQDIIILGAFFGNILSVFDITLNTGLIGEIIFGLFSGMFIGLFSVCLAEAIKALPIFVRRTDTARRLGVLVIAIALGKAFGHLMYYLWT